MALAQGWVTPRCDPAACLPRPPFSRPQVVRTSSDVHAELADRVVRWEVKETFRNTGGPLGEADYLFPLPQGAAFENLQLSINGELVSGETLGADEARRVYEDIVRRKRDPALVEWMGFGLLRARIFPLAAGEEKTVVVKFQSVAQREGDALRLDYLRSDARNDSASDAERWNFTLTYPLHHGYGTPYSPTHNVARVHDGTVAITGPERALTVLVPVARQTGGASITVLPYRASSEDGFAMITLTPPEGHASKTPRDVTFVLDVSGSMNGKKIEQAKAAGRQLVESLRPEDRFRLIDFSTDVRTFRDGWAQATQENVAAAEKYFGQLEAEGSTNIEAALAEALNNQSDDAERLPIVLFITDGEPTVGERNTDKLVAGMVAKRGRTRLFTFGLGADVNTSLLEQLSLDGRGTAQFVRPDESVERAVSLVAGRLSGPVATDLVVHTDDNVQLKSQLPSGAIDLFEGQDAIVLARYTGTGSTHLTFRGHTASGPVEWSETVTFPDRERANPFVARLWATQRIGYLSADRHKHGANPEVDDEIRQLGMRFGIPTELTSYLVQEPQDVAANQPRRLGDSHLQLSQMVVTGVAGGVPAAPAPAQAFRAAKEASLARAATSLAVMDSVAAPSLKKVVRSGGRTFWRQDSVWVDSRWRDGMRVVRVKPYSTAYFALLDAVPELKSAFAVGDAVRVAGRTVAIEVAGDGVEKLSDAEVASVRSDW
ncbi:MAG TPA: VIT domain-containing protein [Gemmatimonadaceae bacterium]|nr:VIT domain-containing protein [Gemmatimonadaceae bacterium]